MHRIFLSTIVTASQGSVPANKARQQQTRFRNAKMPTVTLGFSELIIISKVDLDSRSMVRIFQVQVRLRRQCFVECNQTQSAILHGVLRRPFSRCTIVPGSIRLEQLGNVRNQRIVRIGVRQQRANTQQNFTDRQCWTPLVLENIETNSAVRVDVTVIDACGKVNFGRLQSHCGRAQQIREHESDGWENRPYSAARPIRSYLKRIVGGEMNIQEENTARVRRVFWPHNSCLPVEHVVADGPSGAV